MEYQEKFMMEALRQARKAFAANEVPVGAIIVCGERIIARAHNQVEMLKDATAHAEMLAMTMAASALDNWRLLEATLYVTVEPCMMCVGALFLSRIKRVVWGADDPRQGAGGSFVDLFAKPHPIHHIEVQKGVLAEECGNLMHQFFLKRRQEKKDG